MGTQVFPIAPALDLLAQQQVSTFPLSAPGVSLLRSDPAWCRLCVRFATTRGATNVARYERLRVEIDINRRAHIPATFCCTDNAKYVATLVIMWTQRVTDTTGESGRS
jgi:hypothetical protein